MTEATKNKLLFNRWSDLTRDDRDGLMSRLALENDPFRQSLLDTFLNMDPDELLLVYEDGAKANNWQMMALVIQAMPDDVLVSSGMRDSLKNELMIVFGDSADKNPQQANNLIYRFPYQYALRKLQLMRSDCHSLTVSSMDYNPDKPMFSHIGFYAGIMLEMFKNGEDAKAVDVALFAAFEININNKELTSDVDSYFHGFDFEKYNNDLMEIVLDRVSREKLVKILATKFVESYFQLDDTYGDNQFNILKLIDACDFNEFEELVKDKLKSGNSILDYISNNIRRILSESCRSTFKDKDFIPLLQSICKLHINNIQYLSPKIDSNEINYIVYHLESDQGHRGIYTQKSTIENLFERAYSEIESNKKIWPTNYLDEIVHTALNRNLTVTSVADDLGDLAVRSLVLSGTRHPEILSRLSEDSCRDLVGEMDELGVSFDSRVFMKLNAMSKEDALDRELGI